MKNSGNNYIIDFKNKVIYSVDNSLKRRLIRYVFESPTEMIGFLIKKRRLKMNSNMFDEIEELPEGFIRLTEYTEINTISRQTAYNRIWRGKLMMTKRGKFTFVCPTPSK